MRYQHSKTGVAFANIGMYDTQLDVLIEKSETAIDRNENIRLVKEIQTKALESYGLNVCWLTDNITLYYDSRLQNYEIDPLLDQTYQVGVWLSA